MQRWCRIDTFHASVLLCLLLSSGNVDLTPRTTDGLLGEYYTPLKEDCDAVHGSMHYFRGMLPNISRTDKSLEFGDILAFNLKRCAWEDSHLGELTHLCRNSESIQATFAVRWTGYLKILNPGDYSFSLLARGGARIVMGHSFCPGLTCRGWADVENAEFSSMRVSQYNAQQFAESCPLCEAGQYGTCWVSDQGCEPLGLWQLEADGAKSGTCGTGLQNVTGTRYLTTGLHPVRIEYFKRESLASFSLKYSGKDTGGVFFPFFPSVLRFPEHKGLRADVYYASPGISGLPRVGAAMPRGSLLKRQVNALQNAGPGGSFMEELIALNQAVIVWWSGYLELQSGGPYTFRLKSDDGSRLILAGRGSIRQSVVVDNNGIHDVSMSESAEFDMLAGKNAIRLEYVYGNVNANSAVARPGVTLYFSGPDTGNVEEKVECSGSGPCRLTTNDPGCPLSNFEWGGGMSLPRDCAGGCVAGFEGYLGDSACDSGRVEARPMFDCPIWRHDNGDCFIAEVPLLTTPAPYMQCLVSPPSGGWRQRNPNLCTGDRNGTMCLESSRTDCPNSAAGACNYARCCSARLWNVEYWGAECIGFGALPGYNCSVTLAELLVELRRKPRSAYAAGAGEPARIEGGYLLKDCEGTGCNWIPFGVSPCPKLESPDPGITCYEGPWAVTRVQKASTGCQAGSSQWNFCLNRKTEDGRPFTRCCAFTYEKLYGVKECRFAGIPGGTCEAYVNALAFELSTSRYTAIGNMEIRVDCDGDKCNDPLDENRGCPDDVILPEGSSIYDGAADYVGDGPPWLIIFIIVVGVFVIVGIIGFAASKICAPPEQVDPFMSAKAQKVSQDTWIDPGQDEVTGLNYGVVKPNQHAMKQILKEKQTIPRALRQHPDLVLPELRPPTNAWELPIVEAIEDGSLPALALDAPPAASLMALQNSPMDDNGSHEVEESRRSSHVSFALDLALPGQPQERQTSPSWMAREGPRGHPVLEAQRDMLTSPCEFPAESEAAVARPAAVARLQQLGASHGWVAT